MTERKRLEDQLRQSQKMDALGRLAGGITHDFNNFITALVGYTELALKQIGDDETVYADLKNDLREVLKVGRRAAALTRQLLIFSRSPMLEPAEPVSFDAVIAPRVLEARTGEAAERLAAGHTGSIHVLVTDVIMPGMTGHDLVIRLRRTRPSLRTLFMSGYGQRAIAHHGVLDANAILLEKPFTSDQLLTFLRAILEPADQRSH